VKSSNEVREPREDPRPIAMVTEAMQPRAVASLRATRLFSLVSLALLASGVFVAGRGAYFAFTDAWVAPMQLSPDSREVVALRVQASKDKEQQARLESELTSAAAEIVAIDLSLTRLGSLEASYSKAMRWNTSDRDGQLATLGEQKELLERQRSLTLEPIERYKSAVARAKRDLDAGVITATEFEVAQDNLARTQLTRDEKQLEYLRVNAAIDETSREADALAGAAAHPPSAGRRAAHLASPDVLRIDELRINTELQIARLGAEKRAADARVQAALAGIKGMDELQNELESTPSFLAAKREIDLAFVPYAHLDGIRTGDAVYSCRWFLFGCRERGKIKRFFPGEVVTDDPWGSVARGHYVELEMFDRTAMAERTLRVRRRGLLEGGSFVATRLDR
jgi:hypothetical protein